MAMLHPLIAWRRLRLQTQWRPLCKTLTSGLGLDDMSLAWDAVVQLLIFIYSGINRISHEYSSLFIIVINWFLYFHFDALTELGAFIQTKFLFISVLRVASRPRVKLASYKSALNPPVVYSTDSSKVVVLVLVLLFVALWFILRGNMFYVLPCVILFLCFSVLLALRLITLLGEERANLSAFSMFVWFVLVWICQFPLPLGVWEGLRFVIVALPGLFSYFFL